ncbi:GNAT family N-acetyltransferase [Streptomyces sp. NPDC059168]|uniref:GNAT family N-acetyltransferase n=1 Tax=Streptomyces sp. NPDC059168 TaxID=3346753 RepID=UPI0036A340C0
MTGEPIDVRLREVRDDDLLVLHAYENDPEAVRRSKFTPRPLDAFLEHWRERILRAPDSLVRAVTVDGEVAGSVVSWTAQDGRRFVGYWLGRRYWARGVGTRALGLFLGLERVRPLYADPFSGNTASVRLLERHGFERVGTDREGDDEYAVLALGPAPAEGR